jgi:hypothetical protein
VQCQSFVALSRAKWSSDLMPFFKHAHLTEQQRLLVPNFPPDRILFVVEKTLRPSSRYASCCWLGWASAFGVGHLRSDVYIGKVWMHGVTKRPYFALYLSYMFPMPQSCAQPFPTNGVPCPVTRPGFAEGPLVRAFPPAHGPLEGPIDRNLKVYWF